MFQFYVLNHQTAENVWKVFVKECIESHSNIRTGMITKTLTLRQGYSVVGFFMPKTGIDSSVMIHVYDKYHRIIARYFCE